MRQSTIVRGIAALAALGVATWGGTVTYLEHFDHAGAPKIPANSPSLHDPVSMAAFAAFQEVRCDYCHTKDADLPFYFKLPLANQIMSHDLTEGRMHFNFAPVIEAFQQGTPPTVEQLSRIEEVISQNRMPPAMYLTMHPHAYLNEKQRGEILAWVREQRARFYASADVAPAFKGEVVQPIPQVVAVDWKKAALGRTLYFDKHLSGDGTLNCASCHGLDKGGVDNLVTSTGINGQSGPINAPSVYNSTFNMAQFWDGRAKDLAAQAAGPVTNPKEMGAHNWDEAAARVRDEPGMPELFEAIYGPNSVNKDTVTDAIAEYEKTLITPDSRFDQYLKGDTKAISAQEKRGYERFKEIGCSGCHSGVAMGGDAYEVMGLEGPYFTDRKTDLTDADNGRIGVTRNPNDAHRFKVPNLRNVALTGPWFHDGSAKTLEDAVRMMAKYQTPYGNISDQDVNDITAFLKTLTGKYQGVPVDRIEAQPELKPAGQAEH
ncbi:cytochrome c peroxidase [Neokomagataea thailandica NBRC 106555]|uniref:Cytochrome-c peroxidase n=2 Tax=Neokomagataea TaxID=1223423 RepID=A0A4Y6V5F9_9PROT|nr:MULTISPECIES: cytochrome-c peroxidase [Neokomagataea]QDH25163.1 cytochrome-c peroxidase [Neokomagataea tanensis]GBR51953.1 cytochrome c peroxidase [Neokomagataea thailandica NBRC 106555]